MVAPSRLQFLVPLFLLVTLVAACSNDEDNPTDGGGTDTAPPTVVAITPVDLFHVDVTFNEEVTRNSAEEDDHYVMLEVATPFVAAEGNAVPGDTLHSASLSLKPDKKTVAITTEESMAGLNFSMSVLGVSDTHGNTITTPVEEQFTGSNDPDTTPPTITYRSPAPNATNVPIGQVVVIQFSEPVDYTSFVYSLAWVSDNSDAVPHTVTSENASEFTLFADDPLENGMKYWISLSFVEDIAGNPLPVTSWSFTTTTSIDPTPPTLVSSTPADLATNVGVNENLSLTFSEAVNPLSLDVALTPDPGDGTESWSNGGKTVTFDPDLPLFDNQQYVLTIYPHGVVDLAGNGFEGLQTVVFTTGSALEGGSIAGTIAGDPGTGAADPTGAFVAAATGSVFESATGFDILGSAIVAGNDTYTLSHLSDHVYYPLAMKDTHSDGMLDPVLGDAVGTYGIDFRGGDNTVEPVTVTGASHEAPVNFPLFDPSSISGSLAYDGLYSGDPHSVWVGLFDTTNFDPTDVPVASTEAFWPNSLYWFFVNLFDMVIPSDDYYVGAFLDVNNNGTYEPAVDPVGLYGGMATPTAIHIENGNDAADLVITLEDPLTASRAVSVRWPATKPDPRLQQLRDAAHKAQAFANR